MLCSALILHGKRAYDMKGFWLIKPSRSTISEKREDFTIGCNMHPNLTCGNYLWEGVRNHFLMGLAIDCLRALKRVSKQPLSTKTWTKATNFRMNCGPLFSLYIGLYRVKMFSSSFIFFNLKLKTSLFLDRLLEITQAFMCTDELSLTVNKLSQNVALGRRLSIIETRQIAFYYFFRNEGKG